MMGAAESISDLRSLLSIVAEETGALKMNDADEDSVGWTTEGPLPMTFGHVRRAHAALAALEPALSAAEPIGVLCTGCGSSWGDDRLAEEKARRPELLSCCPERKMIPVYSAPPAPSLAVKALDKCAVDLLLYNLLKEAIQEGMDKATNPDWVTKDFTQSEAYVAIRSAVSAQVQDVAIPEGWQLVPKEPTREMCEAAPSLPAIHAIDDLPFKKSGWSMSAIVNRKRYLVMLATAPAKQES